MSGPTGGRVGEGVITPTRRKVLSAIELLAIVVMGGLAVAASVAIGMTVLAALIDAALG